MLRVYVWINRVYVWIYCVFVCFSQCVRRRVQSSWAGVEVLHDYFREHAEPSRALPVVTRFAGEKSLYGAQMSEWVFAEMIAFERKMQAQAVNQQKREWQAFPVFDSLVDKRLGILGLGAIGRDVARTAVFGFHMASFIA